VHEEVIQGFEVRAKQNKRAPAQFVSVYWEMHPRDQSKEALCNSFYSSSLTSYWLSLSLSSRRFTYDKVILTKGSTMLLNKSHSGWQRDPARTVEEIVEAVKIPGATSLLVVEGLAWEVRLAMRTVCISICEVQ